MRPNPRLQRTPSAPLSRKPLGRQRLAAAARCSALLAAACIVACCTTAGPIGDRPYTVCEAVTRDVAAGGEFVSIRGEVVSGFETFALHSGTCQTDNRAGALIWLEVKSPDERPYARTKVTGPQFLKAEHDGTVGQLVGSTVFVTPQPVVFRSDSAWQKLQTELEKHGNAIATLYGRLDHEEARLVRNPDGSVTLTWGYGHGPSFSRRLVIERVQDVAAGHR